MNDKTFIKETGSWNVHRERDVKTIHDVELQGCGHGMISGNLWTLFHLVEVKNPSWGMTKEKFEQLNLGPSWSEEEELKLGNMLGSYCEVVMVNPKE